MAASDETPAGVVPPGRYAGGGRSPLVWVRLCAYCAGFAPSTPTDYDGYLSGRCSGCGSWSRELHRFAAWIASAAGCNCGTHGDMVVGDLAPEPSVPQSGHPAGGAG